MENYSPDLFRYAMWLFHDKHISEDLVQETFTRAWRNLHQIKDDKAEKGWLTTILRNENARRFQRIQPDLVEIENVPLSANQDDEPEARMEQKILREDLSQQKEQIQEALLWNTPGGNTQEASTGPELITSTSSSKRLDLPLIVIGVSRSFSSTP